MTPGVLIPCAAHVPPRCRGKTKNVCESHAGLRAGITHCIRNPSPKLFPEQPKTWFGGTHSPLKSNLGAPWRTQMRPKRRARAAKRRPKDTQERPRDSQEQPRADQEHSKSSQNAPKMLQTPPKSTLVRPKMHLGCVFRRNLCSKGSGIRFSMDFRASCQSANLDFYCSCQCFVKVEAFTQTKPKVRKNGENKPPNLPKPPPALPKTFQTRARDGPRRPQNDEDASNSPTKCPRTPKTRKIAPKTEK
jgi:hypothetical protein